MHPTHTLSLLLLPLPSLAALNGRCTGSKARGEWKSDGICIKTSTCSKYKGRTKTGACPYDDDDVKCCLIDKCEGSTDEEGLGPKSHCVWTSDSICHDFGMWFDNRCPGGNNYKCCLIP
ncbi:hypothetical protein QBC39DRAFT_260550 [Podospora conica]|nr:hypothetical protein QBC39DRAFT_260550 [Schizothecium conicum]